MKILLDPRVFQYLMLFLDAAATIRWAIAGNWGQTLYWLACTLITVAVTFLMSSS